MDSILESIKKMLGIQPDYRVFDQDLMIHINTVLAILHQIGIGPSEGYILEDGNEIWDDYIDKEQLVMVKTFIYLKVKLVFDPPGSGILVENIKSQISELEWRLLIEGGDDDE